MKTDHGAEIEYHFEYDELLHGIELLSSMLSFCREQPEQEGREEMAKALETAVEAMEALLGKIMGDDHGKQ